MEKRVGIPPLIIFVVLALSACMGSLYSVAPIPKTTPSDAIKSANDSVEIAAAPLSEQRAFKDFDANLLLAGIIAVDVTFTNHSQNTVHPAVVLKSNGGSWKQASPKSALSRVMKYYGVRFYGKESYRKTLEAYENVGLHLGDLSPGEARRGIVFFDVRKDATQLENLVLEVSGAGQPVVLTLN
jgi:hypothetical protein